MKKRLLVVALGMCFTGAAHAASSITLYGVIDAGVAYEHQKSEQVVVDYDGIANEYVYSTSSLKRSKAGLRNGGRSGTRWGLRGVEDLGGGLRAVFQLENGFDVTTGEQRQGGRQFGRKATVGLASDSWGQNDFGRQTNLASLYVPKIADPFTGNFGQSRMGVAFGSTATVRYDNMIQYQTPSMSGFQFGVGYSFNTSGDQHWKRSNEDDSNTRAFTTALRYTQGPVGVALSYDQKMNSSGRGNADTTVRQWNLGAGYDFDMFRVSAAFGQTRNGRFGSVYGWNSGAVFSPAQQAVYDGLDPTNPASQAQRQEMDDILAAARLGLNEFDRGFKSNSFLVGVSVPLGTGTFMASWHMADPRSNPDRMSSNEWDMKKQHTYNLGYIYPISGRTSLYAYGSHAENHSFIDGSDTSIIGAGLRHQF